MMTDNNSGNQDDRNSRPPKDLQGLLRFCVENTKAEDAPVVAREMSPERKEWLSKALNEMTTDPIQEVKQYIRTVGVYLGSQNPTDEARDNAVLSLEALYDWCENYDMANDFMKIGGFAILHELITHTEAEFRSHGFQLIVALVQNNPTCQEAVVQDELLPVMLNVLNTEQDTAVQGDAVQAISCMVRDCSIQSAQQQFMASDGFSVFQKVLQTPGPFRRVVKIAFCLTSMCRQNPQYKDTVCESGIVELLAEEVKGEHQQMHEQVMEALVVVAAEHPPTQHVLARPDLGMVAFLQERLQLLAGKEESEEERQHAKELLQIIQTNSS